jgi:hypothetical protein
MVRGRTAKVAAAGLSLWLWQSGAARAACRLIGEAEIPVVVERGRVLIPSEVNGQKVYFIFDSGAARSLLFRDAADRLKVPTHNVRTADVGEVYGIGGNVALRWGDIGELKLGALSMPHAGMLVGSGGFERPDVAGLIGYDVFARHDLELDLAHSMMRLLKTPGCSDDEMDYWRAPYAVAALHTHSSFDLQSYVDVQLNGVQVEAELDTGAPRSTVTLSGAAHAGVRPGSPDVTPIGQVGGVGGGGTPVWSARFSSFQIGDEKISNPTLTMADLFARTTASHIGSAVPVQFEEPGMLLGFDFFRAHRVIISRDHQKLYFSYNGGPIFEPPQARRPVAAPIARPRPPS